MKTGNTTISSKVGPELLQLFVANNCNVRAIEKLRTVNRYYVYEFIRKGNEPTDRTKKGRAARVALFLSEYRKRRISDVPDYVRIWRGLPKEVRRKAMKEFVSWYQQEGNKEKFKQTKEKHNG